MFKTSMLLILAVFAALASSSLAHPVEHSEPPPARTSEPSEPGGKDAILAGPRVRDRNVESLVRRDMHGRTEVLNVRPEEAAIRRHLVDHIDLVGDATDALRAGDQAKAQRLGRDLFDRFDPAHEHDPLAKPLAAVLTPEEAAQMQRLTDEYWTAWLDAERKAAPGVARE